MPTAQQKQNTAAANVIASIDFAKNPPVQLAVLSRRRAGASATKNVGEVIGVGAKASATKVDVSDIGSASSHSSPSLAGIACIAAIPIRAFLTSITSTQAKKTNPPIVAIPLRFVSDCGLRKWIIFNSFARTAIASRLTRRPGVQRTLSADIACRRIEEATKQPDMFIEPAPAPKQEALAI